MSQFKSSRKTQLCQLYASNVRFGFLGYIVMLDFWPMAALKQIKPWRLPDDPASDLKVEVRRIKIYRKPLFNFYRFWMSSKL